MNKYIYVDTTKEASFVIGHQNDHKANTVFFKDIKLSEDSEMYIALSYTNLKGEVEDVMYPLTYIDYGYTFEIGHPITDNFGEIKAQIVSLKTNEDDEEAYCKQSNVFSMIVLESVTQGDITEFSENPSLENFLYYKVGKEIEKVDEKVAIIENFNWDELHQNTELLEQKIQEIDAFEQNMTDSFNDLIEDVQEFEDRVEELLTQDVLFDNVNGLQSQNITLNNSIESYRYVDITVATTKQVQRFEVINGTVSGKLDIMYRANANIWQLNSEDFAISTNLFTASNGYYLNIDYRTPRYDSSTQWVSISKIVGVK